MFIVQNKVLLFLFLSFLNKVSGDEEPIEVLGFEEIKVFQRQYRVYLDAGEHETCYSFEVDPEQHFYVEYTILNSDPNNGRPYDVQLQIRDEYTKNIIVNVISSQYITWEGYDVISKKTMEVCFINFDMRMDQKYIFWQVVIRGKEDTLMPLDLKKDLNKDIDSTEQMKSSSFKLVVSMNNAQRKLWSIRGSQMQTFMRMEAVQKMIDTWSLAHAVVVVGISVAQAYFLKKMFNDPKMEATRLKVRT